MSEYLEFKNFGQQVRKLLQAKGLSQKKLAEVAELPEIISVVSSGGRQM